MNINENNYRNPAPWFLLILGIVAILFCVVTMLMISSAKENRKKDLNWWNVTVDASAKVAKSSEGKNVAVTGTTAIDPKTEYSDAPTGEKCLWWRYSVYHHYETRDSNNKTTSHKDLVGREKAQNLFRIKDNAGSTILTNETGSLRPSNGLMNNTKKKTETNSPSAPNEGVGKDYYEHFTECLSVGKAATLSGVVQASKISADPAGVLRLEKAGNVAKQKQHSKDLLHALKTKTWMTWFIGLVALCCIIITIAYRIKVRKEIY